MSIAILDKQKRENTLGDNDFHDPDGVPIVALVADLMFAARIRGPAPDARTGHDPEALRGALGPATRLILVDLHARGAVAAIPGFREAAASARVVAFGSHLETEALEAAREAGADRVMARSAFVRELPGLVASAR